MRVPPPRRSVLLASLALLAFAVFFPAVFGDLVSDDTALVEANSHGVLEAVTRRFWQDDVGARGLYRAAYRPATQLPLALLLSTFGALPPVLHLQNLLLHVGVCLLVLRWLTRRLAWTGLTHPAEALQWAAFAGALLFAVHPAHAESVAWISGSTDLWMTLWLLLGCELLEHAARSVRLLAACCFTLAALSKEPALLAPLLCWFDALGSGQPAAERRVRVLYPALGAALGLGLIVSRGFSAAGAGPVVSVELVLAALGFYARGLLLPWQLTFQAPPFVRAGQALALPSWSFALGALVCIAALGVALRALRAGPARAVLADLLWVLVPLAPPVLLQPTLISDRFLYTSVLGVSALAARMLMGALAATQAAPRLAAAFGALAVIVAGTAASVRAAAPFQSEESLWRSQVDAFPAHWKAIDALAERLSSLRRQAEARALFERGLGAAHGVGQHDWQLHFLAHLSVIGSSGRPAWDPSQQQDRAHCDSLFGEGTLTYSTGPVRALRVTQREMDTLLLSDPGLLLLPCAQVLLATQKPAQAALLARNALARSPGQLAARELLGLALARSGQFEQALAALRGPNGAVPASLLPLEQRVRAAQGARAQQGAGAPAQRALGAAHVALILGDTGGARVALGPALADPTDHDAVHLLAQSYVAEQRFELAEQALRKAAALAPADPFWPQSLEALAQARAQAGQP
jgi:tetratricopeptide (TPR) repeat protein